MFNKVLNYLLKKTTSIIAYNEDILCQHFQLFFLIATILHTDFQEICRIYLTIFKQQ